MWTAIVLASLAGTVSAPPKEEVWEGMLHTELAAKNRRKRQKGRDRIVGDEVPLTLRITRNGKDFTGEWDQDGHHVLAIEGTIVGRQFEARATRIVKGQWKEDIVRDMRFVAEIDKKEMRGEQLGIGADRARWGTFQVKKK